MKEITTVILTILGLLILVRFPEESANLISSVFVLGIKILGSVIQGFTALVDFILNIK